MDICPALGSLKLGGVDKTPSAPSLGAQIFSSQNAGQKKQRLAEGVRSSLIALG